MSREDRQQSRDSEEKPFDPKYKGFDEEATRRAQETAKRSREGAAGPKGAYVDEEYLEGGPEEAARREGTSVADKKASVERAKQESED